MTLIALDQMQRQILRSPAKATVGGTLAAMSELSLLIHPRSLLRSRPRFVLDPNCLRNI